MNQILVSDRLYVTNKLKKKKRMYRIQFIASLVLVLIFSGWYIYTELDKSKSEAVSQEMLKNVPISYVEDDRGDEPLVVSMNSSEGTVEVEEQTIEGSYTDQEGITYNYESILKIPKLGIEYPVLTETTDELLKISLNKFWGCSPNSVGNYCIVGHNYKSGKMFGKLSMIKNGDIVQLTDLSGKTVDYKVYNTYIVYPDDVACTSQVTNGYRELTLITCTNAGKQRFIVKCREA